jgi:hypothetical protein
MGLCFVFAKANYYFCGTYFANGAFFLGSHSWLVHLRVETNFSNDEVKLEIERIRQVYLSYEDAVLLRA